MDQFSHKQTINNLSSPNLTSPAIHSLKVQILLYGERPGNNKAWTLAAVDTQREGESDEKRITERRLQKGEITKGRQRWRDYKGGIVRGNDERGDNEGKVTKQKCSDGE